MWGILKSQYKRILKVSAKVSGIILCLGFIPQFLLLLLRIDDPLFNEAFTSLIIVGIGAFLVCWVVLMIIFSVMVIIHARWRKDHPKKTKSVVEDIKESKISAEQLNEVSKAQVRNARAIATIGGISGFIYFMYYIGRAYCEGYVAVLGIPSDLIHYEIQDYVYFGAQIETIWITMAFTSILIGLLMIWFGRSRFDNKTSDNMAVNVVIIYMMCYGLALLLFAWYQIFRPDLVVEKAMTVAILTSCIFLFGIIITVIFFEPDTFIKIRLSKIKSKLFITVAIITIVIAPYMSGQAWGAFKGQITTTTDFPSIELCASRELTYGINWISEDGIIYHSNQELYLLYKTSEFIILKTIDNNTYILKMSDLSSITILDVGKIK
jgi:hypothetical protein